MHTRKDACDCQHGESSRTTRTAYTHGHSVGPFKHETAQQKQLCVAMKSAKVHMRSVRKHWCASTLLNSIQTTRVARIARVFRRAMHKPGHNLVAPQRRGIGVVFAVEVVHQVVSCSLDNDILDCNLASWGLEPIPPAHVQHVEQHGIGKRVDYAILSGCTEQQAPCGSAEADRECIMALGVPQPPAHAHFYLAHKLAAVSKALAPEAGVPEGATVQSGHSWQDGEQTPLPISSPCTAEVVVDDGAVARTR
mmetsp:Transcript_73241/g.210380  ORF Transcript_73241/g.210380 Transcript_73241/m.210380 type:complete len:251 (+) Transcript_73241:148-900(+)